VWRTENGLALDGARGKTKKRKKKKKRKEQQ
jgi:hypothetical protein